jgi:hypothetical protein
MSRQDPNYPKPPALALATDHPDQCRFCGSLEFWDLGWASNFGVDVKAGHHDSWMSFTVRCVKCHATFHANDTRSPLDHTEPLVWQLGLGEPG